ncbi:MULTISPECIES: FDLD family class I lanthipeptide [unclassified Crossiella]|uniref:FDLD family class I lanthipeptide n=1 Tax=unclassified Crossiella TaxID=2620835 RepID=UPI00207C97DB|nr:MULTISPECIES: FDLD family class I lanthipeptide [unclassified Crossiella]MCO1574677.1 FDLD family class I lanthipeptide [Crossiella sp. SN42]WHT22879.1 FDLD family class I lanthipeptide [Crossiella sp. CA-258035]
MDAFDLDARVSTPAASNGQAQPLSITSVITRLACTRTPLCSGFTCRCTQGACTAGCPKR